MSIRKLELFSESNRARRAQTKELKKKGKRGQLTRTYASNSETPNILPGARADAAARLRKNMKSGVTTREYGSTLINHLKDKDYKKGARMKPVGQSLGENEMRPLTVDTLFEASEEAMEVGRKIKKRANKIRGQNASVRSGEPVKDKGHAQHVFRSDATSFPKKKEQLTSTQRNALSNRARRQLKPTPSKRAQRDNARTDAWNNYQGDSDNR